MTDTDDVEQANYPLLALNKLVNRRNEIVRRMATRSIVNKNILDLIEIQKAIDVINLMREPELAAVFEQDARARKEREVDLNLKAYARPDQYK